MAMTEHSASSSLTHSPAHFVLGDEAIAVPVVERKGAKGLAVHGSLSGRSTQSAAKSE